MPNACLDMHTLKEVRRSPTHTGMNVRLEEESSAFISDLRVSNSKGISSKFIWTKDR